jgi:hypothetical protein
VASKSSFAIIGWIGLFLAGVALLEMYQGIGLANKSGRLEGVIDNVVLLQPEHKIPCIWLWA